MKIVYMGTPAFAVPPLDVLHKSDHEVVACVTAPDRPAGRGRKLRSSDVKNYCLEQNIPVLQPKKLRDEQFIDALKTLNADIFIVVAFRMLPEIIWNLPKKGTINLHASLLPEYRGAAPINWAIINGEQKSGLTTFFINDKIDTGSILLQKEILIDDTDSFGSLHDKMMNEGGALLLNTINKIDKIDAREQISCESEIKSAPKLNRTNTHIDWNGSESAIHNHIRGLSPFPGAWTEMYMNGEIVQIKILESKTAGTEATGNAGTFFSKGKNLHVNCENGSLIVTRAQIQGKKAMGMDEILRGYGELFSSGRFIF